MKTTKEKFLSSALKLFNEKGFENTSTTAICTDAGYSSGAMFFHFKTKNDLLDSLFLSIKKDSAKYILENLGNNLEPDEKIREIIRISLNYYLDNYKEYIFMKSFTESKHFSRVANTIVSEEVKMFFEIIEEGKTKGLFIDEDVNLIFIGLNALIYNFVNYIKENDNNALERCIDYIMRGILK